MPLFRADVLCRSQSCMNGLDSVLQGKQEGLLHRHPHATHGSYAGTVLGFGYLQ